MSTGEMQGGLLFVARATPSFAQARRVVQSSSAGTRPVIRRRFPDDVCLPRSRRPASLTADLPHVDKDGETETEMSRERRGIPELLVAGLMWEKQGGFTAGS